MAQSGARLMFSESTFLGNTASYDGGALYINSAGTTATFTSVVFQNNTAVNGKGGAIFLIAGGHVVLEGGENVFQGNAAVLQGGNVLGNSISKWEMLSDGSIPTLAFSTMAKSLLETIIKT